MTKEDIYAAAQEALDLERAAAIDRAQASVYLDDAKAAEDQAKAKRAKIAEAMADGGHQEISGPACIITYRKAGPGSVVITDEAAIPPAFMVTPPPPAPKPDKNAIKSAIKAGDDVPGAMLSNAPPSVSIKEIKG